MGRVQNRIYRAAVSKRARKDLDFRKNTRLAYRNQYINLCLAQLRKSRSFHAVR